MSKPTVISISIILNVESGQMQMQGPSNPIVCADVLTRAIQSCLVNAAKQQAAEKPKVEVAGAGLLKALPPVEANGAHA